jgi:phage terminase small subunit
MRRTLRSDMEQLERRFGLEPCPVRERLLQALEAEHEHEHKHERDEAPAHLPDEAQQHAGAQRG